MAAVLFRNLFMHLLLVVIVVADGRGHVSGSLNRHELNGEEMPRQLQSLERFVGQGVAPIVRQPAADVAGSGLQDLTPHLPLGSLADALEQPALDREAAAQEQKLEKMAEFMGAAQVTAAGSVRSRRSGNGGGRQRLAAAATAAGSGSFVELQSIAERRDLANKTEESLMELPGHKPQKVHLAEKVHQKKPVDTADAAMSLAATLDGEPERDRRHSPSAVCYNELTVLGDLNEDGRFSPEEWHQMFKALNSKSKDTNWRISPEDFRKGLPNCDFLEFRKGDLKSHEEKDKMWNHIDYYEWQGVMENADKDRDFLLNHDELVKGGFEPHAEKTENTQGVEEETQGKKPSL